MSRTVRFALLADGMSDKALVSVIGWTLAQCDSTLELSFQGFRNRNPAANIVDEMLGIAASLGPDILFVHRDAETMGPEARRREIPDSGGCLVRVIPVRMTEAWLLFHEQAIRTAAGNPAGCVELGLPALHRIEQVPDPKARLHEALLTAADVSGRRHKLLKRDLPRIVHRVAELIDDFGPLRELPAYRLFEDDCMRVLSTLPLVAPQVPPRLHRRDVP